MDAVLIRLLWLRTKAGIRSRAAELSTVRGFLFMVVTVFIIGWLLMASAIRIDQLPAIARYIGSPENRILTIDRFVPVTLLGMAFFSVFTASGPALHFTAAEINLLFTAPISRRGLLLYKFVMYTFGGLLSAALLSLVVSTDFRLTLFIGVFLTLIFKQLFSVVVAMMIEATRSMLFRNWHRFAAGGLGIALLSALVWAMIGADSDVLSRWDAFRSTPGVRFVLAPFVPFAQLFAAQGDTGSLIFWGIISIAINAGLMMAIIFLDGFTYERSLAADETRHERWAVVRNSGRLLFDHTRSARSRRSAPRLAGIGAIAWRQWVVASRSSARTIWFFVCVMAAAGLLMTGWASDVIGPSGKIAAIVLISVFFLPRSMVFDFRADLQTIERFKALPLAPWRICLGQLAVPVLLTSLMEFVLISCAMLYAADFTRWVGYSLLPYLIPFNLVLYSIENLLFLVMPTSMVPTGRMDFEFMGRTLVDLSIKFAVLAMATISAIAFGVWARASLHDSLLMFGVATWLALLAIGLAMLPLLSISFQRYDVTFRGAE